jgi:hypothetical protein
MGDPTKRQFLDEAMPRRKKIDLRYGVKIVLGTPLGSSTLR